MSKASKCIQLRNQFELCYVKKTQSQSIFPKSVEKGSQHMINQTLQKKSKNTKIISKPEFDLSHRKVTQNNNFLSFYRIKSLVCPVTHLKVEDLKNFNILGTFDKKIIVGFNKKLKLFCFFDQHAMHERIRYEYYLECLSIFDKEDKRMKKWDSQIIEKDQKNLKVVSGIRHCYMSLKVISSFDSKIEADMRISKYGFEILYIKKEMTLKIMKVPLILQRNLENKIILEIAHSLIFDSTHLPKSFESIIAEISCKSAYKFNDLLDISTIELLIKNLSLCQYPFFCVHGRPTLFTRI